MTEQLFSILFSTQTIPPKQNSIDYIFLGWDCHGIEYYLNINGYVSAFSSSLLQYSYFYHFYYFYVFYHSLKSCPLERHKETGLMPLHFILELKAWKANWKLPRAARVSDPHKNPNFILTCSLKSIKIALSWFQKCF